MRTLTKGATVLAMVALALVSCQKDKYAEVKKVMNDYIAMTDQLNKAMEDADSGAEVAAALKVYVARAKDLGPQMEGLPERYPELEDEDSLPPELKDLMAQVEGSLQGMAGMFGKLMEYGEDPAVQEAMAEFEQME